jgi:hypothetical protein
MVCLPDADLTEEEMILANAASESTEAEQTIQKAALVLKMREGIGSMARILKTIEVSDRQLALLDQTSVLKEMTASCTVTSPGYYVLRYSKHLD